MNKIQQVAQIMASSQAIVCLTGAGACTDSGIPDYRGTGTAYWEKYNLKDMMFQQFIASEEARKSYWQMEQEFYELVQISQPNGAHLALVELERMGKLQGIITQNVDGLHQKAGSSPQKVIEIHGSILTVGCLQCFKKYGRDEIAARIKSGVAVPYCSYCYGILKSDTISFGQPLPQQASAQALMATLQSDLFLVIGSSLLVQPASYLIIKAKEAGAKVVIINLSPTPYDSYADVLILDNAQQSMTAIMQIVSPPAPLDT